MKLTTHFLNLIFYVACTMFVAGCGGGGGGSTSLSENLPEPPPSGPPSLLPAPSQDLAAEYEGNYALNNMNVAAAYVRNYLGQNVTVGVVDTGMRLSHEDLAANIVGGYNSIDGSDNINEPISNIYNSIGHGSAVGGVIAAAANGRGVVGVAPAAKLQPLQIGNSNGALGGNAAKAIEWAAQRNTPIINNSYGYNRGVVGSFEGREYEFNMPFGLLGEGFQSAPWANAVSGKDMVVVWAGGNEGWHSGGRVRLCGDGFDNCANPSYRCMDNCIVKTPEQIIAGFNSISYRANYQFTLRTPTSLQPIMSGRFISGLGMMSTLNLTTTGPGILAHIPLAHPEVIKNWLVGVATDKDNNIAGFSNGCGVAKMWCLAAPGVSVPTVQGDGDREYGAFNGTSFSAPNISGALAVLRGRMPAMPMETVRAVLLQSATDLGAPGVDDIYGWGLVNVSMALELQSRMSSSGFSQAVLSGNEYIELPPLFADSHNQLNNVQVAVSVFNNLHYNIPLGKLMRVTDSDSDSASKLSTLPQAAASMLTVPRIARWDNGFLFADIESSFAHNIGAMIETGALGKWRVAHQQCRRLACADNVTQPWHGWKNIDDKTDDTLALHDGWKIGDGYSTMKAAPFFATDNGTQMIIQKESGTWRPFITRGGGYLQYGLGVQTTAARLGSLLPMRLLAEVSRIDEAETMWGWRANFGGTTSGRSEQIRLRAQTMLSDNWHGFADYKTARGEAATTNNNVLRSLSHLRAAGWAAGFDGRNLFMHGDNMRLSARRPMTIIGGRAVFEHKTATGDFTDAFYRQAENQASEQQIYTKQTAVDLSADSALLLRWGYSRPFRLQQTAAKMAIAAEHQTDNHKTAFSAKVEVQF